jgi:FixJ family two-component response regulator
MDSQLLDSILAEYLTQPITARQRRTIDHIVAGRGSKDQADADGLSFNTVHVRRNKLYKLLRVGGARQIQADLLAIVLRRLDARNAERGVANG